MESSFKHFENYSKSKFDKAMKCLIFAKSIDGGTGTFLLSLLKIKRYFPQDSVEIKTLVLETPTYRNINQNFVFLRKKKFYPNNYYFSLKNIILFFQELSWYKKNIKEFSPDIIISIDVHCNLISCINKFLFSQQIKIITTTHNNLSDTLNEKSSLLLKYILKNTISFFYNKSNLNICISKDLTKSLHQNFRIQSPVKTIYYGLTPPKLRPIKLKHKRKFTILSVGRLVKQKDFLTLLKAFKLLQYDISNTKLTIAGDGPLKKDLELITKTLNIEKNVTFIGWKEEINDSIRKADLFVLSSKREGFSYALLEAMSNGIPVISTNAPYGPSEILQDGKYGLLTPVGNEYALKNAILTLLTKDKKYFHFAKNSYERSKYFSEEKMLTAYKKTITTLLKDI